MKIPRFPVAALMGLVLFVALAIASLRFASAIWAALLLAATWIVIGLAALTAIYRTGPKRAFWLGFTLFGSGYLALSSGEWWPDRGRDHLLASTILLDAAEPYLDPAPGAASDPGLAKTAPSFLGRLFHDPDAPDREIREALEAPVSMPFVHETPLDDVVKYVKASTISPGLPHGIPIYVDPVGLQEAEKTMSSPASLELEGVALKSTLRLILKPLGLNYRVGGGLLTITRDDSNADFDPDAFHRVGHCWFSLLLGLLGGIAARRVRGDRAEPFGV